MTRQLRPTPYVCPGHYSVEESFSDRPFASRSVAVFEKPEDRDDFLALIEFKEHLAPKLYTLALRHTTIEGVMTWLVNGGEGDFYGATMLEAVRRARALVEGDPELLP